MVVPQVTNSSIDCTVLWAVIKVQTEMGRIVPVRNRSIDQCFAREIYISREVQTHNEVLHL